MRFALSSDRHGYMELSKLIDGLDPKNVRPVIDAVQALPNRRKKKMLVAMLFSRWADADPQAAIAYAQTAGTISERTMMITAAVRSWTEKDANAAQAWVLQLAPGQEREHAMQAVVSALSEKNPQAALALLQSLPEHERGPQHVLADLFELGQHRPGDGGDARGCVARGSRAR